MRLGNCVGVTRETARVVRAINVTDHSFLDVKSRNAQIPWGLANKFGAPIADLGLEQGISRSSRRYGSNSMSFDRDLSVPIVHSAVLVSVTVSTHSPPAIA